MYCHAQRGCQGHVQCAQSTLYWLAPLYFFNVLFFLSCCSRFFASNNLAGRKMQPCIKRPWCPQCPIKAPHTHKSCTHLRQKASKHKQVLDDKTKFVVATLTLLNCLKTCWFCRKDMAKIHYIHKT